MITKFVPSCSSTLITLNSWGSSGSLDKVHIDCAAGVWDNAEDKVIIPFPPGSTLVVVFSSTFPSGNKTKHFWLLPSNPLRSLLLSTVIVVVVADFILPDLLSPPLTGSATDITPLNFVAGDSDAKLGLGFGAGDFGGYSSFEEWAVKDPTGYKQNNQTNSAKGIKIGYGD